MELFNIFTVYFFFVTISLNTAQAIDSNLIKMVTKAKDIKRDTLKIEQDSSLEKDSFNKDNTNNSCSDSIGQSNDRKFNTKLLKTPLNLVIDNKPRKLPIKIPLVIKTGNVKPSPMHYVRLANSPMNNAKTKIEEDVITRTSSKKVTPFDIVTHKKKPHKHHHHRKHNFFEEDTDDQVKSDCPELTNTENEIDDETGKRANDFVTFDSNYTDNGTHSIKISKIIPQCYPNEFKENDKDIDKNLQQYTLNITQSPLTPNNAVVEEASKPGKVAEIILENDHDLQQFLSTDCTKINSSPPEGPVIKAECDNVVDSPHTIIIKNRNYEEFEESIAPALDSIPINGNDYRNEPTTSLPINPFIDPYNSYVQNDQTTYYDNKYNNVDETNDVNGDCFNIDPPDIDAGSPSEQSQLITTGKQLVQDIYSQKSDLQNNFIDIKPENLRGRIWRNWRDTEIKIANAKYLNNLYRRRSLNDINNFGVFAKTPALCTPQIAGVNGYYNNLNKVWPYTYQTNRYML